MEAYAGDRVVIRQLQPAYEDHHVFHLHGHSWRLEREEPRSQLLGDITNSVGTAYDIELEGGASAGDHLYHCHIMDHKKMGMWGLFRVHEAEQLNLRPLIKEQEAQKARAAVKVDAPAGGN
jgi:FtsP/CotA-like multicopper oxidase with cupredoxin domain